MTPAESAWIETRDGGGTDTRAAETQPSGRIEIVTDEPIEIDDRTPARAWAAVSRRAWVPPALILGLVASYLLLRSR